MGVRLAKRTNPDWIVIYLMDSFVHLYNIPGQALVVRKVDNTIYWTNHYLVDGVDFW